MQKQRERKKNYTQRNAKQEETAEYTGLNNIIAVPTKTKWSRAQINQIVITRNERKHAPELSGARARSLIRLLIWSRQQQQLNSESARVCVCACRLICSNIVFIIACLLAKFVLTKIYIAILHRERN